MTSTPHHAQTAPCPGPELRFWLALTRRLPQVRGAGRIGAFLARIYERKARSEVAAQVFRSRMILDPADNLERQFLFCPQLFDWTEIACLRQRLQPAATFLDAGANVGFYTLIASDQVGPAGQVIAVEADPRNAARLTSNLQLNGIKNVRLVNVGLSDKIETLQLGLDQGGNRGGHSFLYDSTDKVEVPCMPLTDVLVSSGISRVDVAKFDIEGFEFRVLERFFRDGQKHLWPRFILIEHNPFFVERAGGDAVQLLSQNGYSLVRVSELNYLATRG